MRLRWPIPNNIPALTPYTTPKTKERFKEFLATKNNNKKMHAFKNGTF